MAPVSTGSAKSLGMTAPISSVGPEPRDLQLSIELQDALRFASIFRKYFELFFKISLLLNILLTTFI